MQCPRCGTALPDGSVHCFNCGALVAETTPTVNEAQSPAGFAPLAGEAPYVESGWAEFSGLQYPDAMSADAVAAPTVASLPPGDTGSPGYYPPPGGDIPSGYYPYGSVPPGYVPPATPPPTRRRPRFALAVVLGVLVLLLIVGGIFVGVSIGQSHNVPPVQATLTATVGAPQSASQLYQQVTSQAPAFVDSLQDATVSPWAVSTKPTYGCEIESDGLHLYIKDTGHFYFCTSGRGEFSNFAFQVGMKILSGGGGGIVFRSDNVGGNLYYFHVYPDGSYHIYLSQNHNLTTLLGEGTISSFTAGFGQKNTLAVIAQGNQIYFYANQKFITEIQNSTYSKGYVGVMANDLTSPAEVVYTNAQIWIL